MDTKILIAAVAFGFYALSKSRSSCIPFKKGSGARGLRNNNPGNIRISNSNWVGKVPISCNNDGSFEQFYEVKNGVRAAVILINNNYLKKGQTTIESILYKYAPPTENDTEAYIKAVVNCSGIGRNEFLGNRITESNKVDIAMIINCIFSHENGISFDLSFSLFGNHIANAINSLI